MQTEPPSDTPPASLLRDQIESWVSATLAARSVVEPIKDTTGFTARIKGLPSCWKVGETESAALDQLRERLHRYAETCIAEGKALPVWERAPVEVPAEVTGIVRVSRLRKLLLSRAAAWSITRQKLPSGVVDLLLADLDKLITRHATSLNGSPPGSQCASAPVGQ